MADSAEVKEIKRLNLNVKQFADGLKGAIGKASDTISSQVGDIMTEELKETTGVIKSGYESMKQGITSMNELFNIELYEKSPVTKKLRKGNEVREDLLKVQQELLDIEKMRFKFMLAKVGTNLKRGGGWLFGLLAVPLMALGATLGMVTAGVTKPFKILFKLIPGFTALMTGLGKIGAWVLLKDPTKGVQKGIIRMFGIFGKIADISKLPIINQLVRGFKFGFTKLFWPFQIILSTIDFIEGYMATEGNIYDKIKAGLENVVVKFFEWPLTFLGNLWDWLLTKMGFESEGTGKALVSKLGDLTAWLLEGGPFKFVIDMIRKVDWDKVFMAIGDFLRMLFDIGEKLGKFARDFRANPIKATTELGAKIFEGSFTRPDDKDKLEQWRVDALKRIEKSDMAAAGAGEAESTKAQKEAVEVAKDTNKEIRELKEAILGRTKEPVVVPIPAAGGGERPYQDTTTPDIDNAAFGVAM